MHRFLKHLYRFRSTEAAVAAWGKMGELSITWLRKVVPWEGAGGVAPPNHSPVLNALEMLKVVTIVWQSFWSDFKTLKNDSENIDAYLESR